MTNAPKENTPRDLDHQAIIDDGSSYTNHQKKPTRRSLLPMILLVLLVAIAGRAAYIWVTGGHEFDLQRFAFMEPGKTEFFPVTGEIYFNDEKVTHGHLEAYATSGNVKLTRVIGLISEDGTFEFFTDIGGTLSKGLPAGTFKLILQVNYPATGFGYPDHMLPEKYYSTETTPVEITVTDDRSKNHFEIRESGEIQLQSGGSRGQTGGSSNEGVDHE